METKCHNDSNPTRHYAISILPTLSLIFFPFSQSGKVSKPTFITSQLLFIPSSLPWDKYPAKCTGRNVAKVGKGKSGKRQKWEKAKVGKGKSGKRQKWEKAKVGKAKVGKVGKGRLLPGAGAKERWKPKANLARAMALNTITKFNWEKILSKVDNVDLKRTLNAMRAKSNEIAAAHVKYGKAPEPVDFAAYKNKLRFTSSAVETLEKAYASKKLPVFTAEVPSLEAKKREMILAAAGNIVNAAQAELANLNNQIEEFEKTRMGWNTTYYEACDRFPEVAKEVEEEIKNNHWMSVPKQTA
jgi:hypothetical protein